VFTIICFVHVRDPTKKEIVVRLSFASPRSVGRHESERQSTTESDSDDAPRSSEDSGWQSHSCFAQPSYHLPSFLPTDPSPSLRLPAPARQIATDDCHQSMIVVPGQVIATTSIVDAGDPSSPSSETQFLRGHGTFVEEDLERGERRLVASVVGTVVRVNKLVLVESTASSVYRANVGDLVVGRIAQVGNQRWSVELCGGSTAMQASLPLSGVHLPGGIQRIRTQQDAREMRLFLKEGDLVSAEVHKVTQSSGGGGDASGGSGGTGGTVMLHTRSARFGKLENGCVIEVPPALVPRLKQHSVRLLDRFDVLLGCNGRIWMQRKMTSDEEEEGTGAGAGTSSPPSKQRLVGQQELAEVHERQQRRHRDTPMSLEDRRALARLRNSVACLRAVHILVTPQHVQHVYLESLKLTAATSAATATSTSGNGAASASASFITIPQMLHPVTMLRLTEGLRTR